MKNTPPPSNLGPMSQPWAGWITDQTVTNRDAIESLGGDASNDGRINNSALDTLAGNIKELYERQSQNLILPNVTTPSFNNSGATVTATLSHQLPRPTDSSRIGWMALNASPSVSPAVTSTVFVTYSMDGAIFYRSSIFLPVADSTPSGWNNMTFFAATGFVGSPTSGGLLEITLQAYGLVTGAATSRTASLSNITATLAYGQKG